MSRRNFIAAIFAAFGFGGATRPSHIVGKGFAYRAAIKPVTWVLKIDASDFHKALKAALSRQDLPDPEWHL